MEEAAERLPDLSRLKNTMESFLQQYSKEYMKTAMLKHEETFREQVSELHRLYRVQKLLMRDMQQKEEHAKQQRSMHLPSYEYVNQSCLQGTVDLDRPAEEYIDANKMHALELTQEEGDVELTLALGTTRRRKEDGSVGLESGTSFSFSSADENLNLHGWGPFQIPVIDLNCPGNSSDFMGMDAISCGRRKPASWHLPYLSLNIR